MASFNNFGVRIFANVNDAVNGLKKFKGEFNTVTRSIQKSGGNMAREVNTSLGSVGGALASAGIIAAYTTFVDYAMKTDAALSQVNYLLGDNAKGFMDWARTGSQAYGLAMSDTVRFGAIYANLTSTFSDNTEDMKQRTIDLLKTSAVVASARGTDMTDVMERIRSGMLGNTEAIEDLGINVYTSAIEQTKAFKEMGKGAKTWDDIQSFSLKQQIRYYAILEQAQAKYGDSLRDTTATRMLLFNNQLKDIKLNLGGAFLPILDVVLPALTKLAGYIAGVTRVVAQFLYVLFGKRATSVAAKQTDQQAKSVGGLGDAYQEAGKKAKGALAGFDEINSLSQGGDGAGGAGADAGGGLPTVPTDTGTGLESLFGGASESVTKFAESIRKAFLNIKDFLGQSDLLSYTIKTLAVGLGTFVAVMVTFNAIAKAARLITLAWNGIMMLFNATMLANPVVLVIAAVAALVAMFIYAYKNNEAFRDMMNKLWETMKSVGKFIAEIFILAFKALSDFFVNMYKVTLATFILVFEGLWTLLKNIATFLKDVFTISVNGVKTAFEAVSNFIKNVFTATWNGLLKLFQNLKEIDAIKKAINSIKTVFSGVSDFITGVFSGDWEKALEGLSKIAKGIFEGMVTIVKTPINMMIDGVNALIGGLNKLSGLGSKGLKKLGIDFDLPSLPTIPKLARGGIVSSPTIAQVGEAGSEMVVPLENTPFVDKLASALGTAVMSAMQGSGTQTGGGSQIILDGVALARAIQPYTSNESTRLGKSMIVSRG